jgi:hypothetical protein
VAAGCSGRGGRSRPFVRIDSILFYAQAPSVSARRQAASSRSSPELLPNRMMPTQARNPCGGWGRDASLVSTTWAVAGPLWAAQWPRRCGGHGA